MLRITVFTCFLISSCAGFSQSVRYETLKTSMPNKYSAVVVSPVFNGTVLGRLVQNSIRAEARGVYTEFLKGAREFFASSERTASEWELEMKPTIGFYSKDILSFFWDRYDYSGGAHPNSAYMPMNFALIKGRSVKLTFGLASGSRDKVGHFVDKLLIPRLNAAKKARGADPVESFDADLLDQFVITKGGMTWLFSKYDVGPYVEGSYEVKFTWAELKPYIDPKGPMSIFVSGR